MIQFKEINNSVIESGVLILNEINVATSIVGGKR